ncbi:hypothetical protein FRC08_014453 [Ceratobasidium sp. 394]|nr:hypothetical protein FRC08_014453 [Ceratobasidium sp. 394]
MQGCGHSGGSEVEREEQEMEDGNGSIGAMEVDGPASLADGTSNGPVGHGASPANEVARSTAGNVQASGTPTPTGVKTAGPPPPAQPQAGGSSRNPPIAASGTGPITRQLETSRIERVEPATKASSIAPTVPPAAVLGIAPVAAPGLVQVVAPAIAVVAAPPIPPAASPAAAPAVPSALAPADPRAGSQGSSKRRAESPEGPGQAKPARVARHNSGVDPALVRELMPKFSFPDVESTSVRPTDDLQKESGHLGVSEVVRDGHFFFQVSNGGPRQGRELYGSEAPWDIWNSLQAVGTAKQFLSTNLQDSILCKLPMQVLLKMYATAAFHDEDIRGPMQKRLVARIAMLAGEGRLLPRDLETWVKIQQVLRAWETSFAATPDGHSLPDFSACFV